MPKLIRIGLLCLALAGCNSINVKYVDASGLHGAGKLTGGAVNFNDGKLTIADRGVTCSGSFPSWESVTVVFPVKCTDGASGTVTMTRPPVNQIAGEGAMQLTNGQTRRFVFGQR